jgi:tRNA threonylcarbamoyladenosine biosynthesis protein TsaB
MSDPSNSYPLLLSLDTCGAEGSVVLGRIDLSEERVEILAKAAFAGRTHSAQLIPKIAELLAGQKAAIGDVQAIVIVLGPGSFTGIRVGLSAAKGLADAVGLKLIGLSRLAVLAHVSGLPNVLAVIDAGRGEYYTGDYRAGSRPRERLLTAGEVCAAAQEPDAGVVVCESSSVSPAASDSLAGNVSRYVCVPSPDAADALRFAMKRFRAGDFDDPETLDANYLRRSDAELFGAGGTGVRRGAGAIPIPEPGTAQGSK